MSLKQILINDVEDFKQSLDPRSLERSAHLFMRRAENMHTVGNLMLKNPKPELMEELQRATDAVVRSYGSLEDWMLGIRNEFHNLPLVLESLDCSQTALKGNRAVYLGAGPSADHPDIPKFLRQLESTHWIVCPDICLSKVLNMDLEPDFVVSTERTGPNSDCLKDLPDTHKTTLIAPPVVETSCLGLSPRPIMFVHRRYESFRFFEYNSTPIASLPSVTPTTIGALAQMGIKHMTLLGQDFAHETIPDDPSMTRPLCKLYNEKIDHFEHPQHINSEDLQPVKGMFGQTIYTTPILLDFADHTFIMGYHSSMNLITTAPTIHTRIPYVDLIAAMVSETTFQEHLPEKQFLPKRADHNKALMLDKMGKALRTLKSMNVRAYKPEALVNEPTVKHLIFDPMSFDLMIYKSQSFRDPKEEKSLRDTFHKRAEIVINEILFLLNDAIIQLNKL